MMQEQLGRKIRLLRHRRGLTQQEIAYRTGISTPHISSIERGERHPSLEYAIRIAEALSVPIGFLCDGADITSLPDDTSYGGDMDLPGYLKSFVMNESSQQYIAMAHRVSHLDESDYQILCTMVDIMSQRRKLKAFNDQTL